MHDARCREAWAHTSNILCFLAEPHRDRKRRSRPYTAADFNPFSRPRGRGSPVTVERLTREILALSGQTPRPHGSGGVSE